MNNGYLASFGINRVIIDSNEYYPCVLVTPYGEIVSMDTKQHIDNITAYRRAFEPLKAMIGRDIVTFTMVRCCEPNMMPCDGQIMMDMPSGAGIVDYKYPMVVRWSFDNFVYQDMRMGFYFGHARSGVTPSMLHLNLLVMVYSLVCLCECLT